MTTPNSWLLSWSTDSYLYEERLAAAEADSIDRVMFQSWGRHPTTNIGRFKAGDVVYISCNKECVAKGRIIQPFRQYDTIQHDRFVIRQVDQYGSRQTNSWGCQIYLDEIPSKTMRKELLGNQQTLCNPTKSFWKKDSLTI